MRCNDGYGAKKNPKKRELKAYAVKDEFVLLCGEVQRKIPRNGN